MTDEEVITALGCQGRSVLILDMEEERAVVVIRSVGGLLALFVTETDFGLHADVRGVVDGKPADLQLADLGRNVSLTVVK